MSQFQQHQSTQQTPLPVLIADDHELMREALAQLLVRRWPEVQCRFARDFAQTISQLEAASALSCIILDLRMPGMRGIEGARQILALAQGCPVIVWTGADDPRMVSLLEKASVFAVAFKSESSENLLDVMAKLPCFNGSAVQTETSTLANSTQAVLNRHGGNQMSSAPAFTDRQLEIMRLLHDGRPNKLIADELNISLGTVKNHISLIFTKMQVRSRSELLSKTREWLL